jgi:AhpD family alkylhydroperoxidase
MMSDCERSDVRKELSALAKMTKQLTEEVPAMQAAFTNFMGECLCDGVLSLKIRELVCIGAAVAKSCKPCIVAHVSKALAAGANRAEIIEAGYMGVLMGGGPGFIYMQYLLDALDELDK